MRAALDPRHGHARALCAFIAVTWAHSHGRLCMVLIEQHKLHRHRPLHPADLLGDLWEVVKSQVVDDPIDEGGLSDACFSEEKNCDTPISLSRRHSILELFANYRPETINLIVLGLGQSQVCMLLRGSAVIYTFLRKPNGQLAIGNLR